MQSAAWREALARYRWNDRYLAGDAFARSSDSEEARVLAILRKLGTGGTTTATLASAGPYPLLVLAGLAITGLLAASGLARRSGRAASGRSHQRNRRPAGRRSR